MDNVIFCIDTQRPLRVGDHVKFVDKDFIDPPQGWCRVYKVIDDAMFGLFYIDELPDVSWALCDQFEILPLVQDVIPSKTENNVDYSLITRSLVGK